MSADSAVHEVDQAAGRADAVPKTEQPSSSRRWSARVATLLRQPLVHFLVAGLALFVVYRAMNPATMNTDPRRIELTADDIRQLDIGWMSQWGRPPTAEELRGLIDARLREEILYREALALGLDREDQIVKRRMAQKMDFLAEDVSRLTNPEPHELEAWYAANASRFALPAVLTFRHLYFSPDVRGASARIDAGRAAAALAGEPGRRRETDRIGDRFMFDAVYTERSRDQVASVFGTGFAEALYSLEPGTWHGPIESGLGWHVVRIDSITPGRVPAYSELDPAEVRSEWMSDRREEYRRMSFEMLKDRYQIVLPTPADVEAALVTPPPAGPRTAAPIESAGAP